MPEKLCLESWGLGLGAWDVFLDLVEWFLNLLVDLLFLNWLKVLHFLLVFLESFLNFLFQLLIVLDDPEFWYVDPLKQFGSPLTRFLANTAIIRLHDTIEKVLDAW